MQFAALDDGPLRVLDAGSVVGDVAAGGMPPAAAPRRPPNADRNTAFHAGLPGDVSAAAAVIRANSSVPPC